jgi:hypothetical protein
MMGVLTKLHESTETELPRRVLHALICEWHQFVGLLSVLQAEGANSVSASDEETALRSKLLSWKAALLVTRCLFALVLRAPPHSVATYVTTSPDSIAIEAPATSSACLEPLIRL